jgi:esterase/lipase superfamily enzyme
MHRVYYKWFSSSLEREMELLVFGETGRPALVFPTSGGRFYEFEDHGMVAALADKIEAGELQLFCVDSVNAESWYNVRIAPRQRILRHMEYERYLLHEVRPFLREQDGAVRPLAMGCSFGGYHAVNLALRHPEFFAGFLSLSGTFDVSTFLDGYCDKDCYLQLPTFYLPNLADRWFLDHFRANSFVLVTGWDDQCLEQNQNLDRILTERNISHRFDVWDAQNSHDWPTWQRMAAEYL